MKDEPSWFILPLSPSAFPHPSHQASVSGSNGTFDQRHGLPQHGDTP
jgi:hypothetical protein